VLAFTAELGDYYRSTLASPGCQRRLTPQHRRKHGIVMQASSSHLVMIPSYNPGPKVDATVREARAQWNRCGW
jgi:hypothetical protein